MSKTLVKTKIVLEDNDTSLVTYFWKKSFWIFGRWYPFGCTSCIGKIPKEKINSINDKTVSKVIFNEFISNSKTPIK